jgi:very-short-patch-repair endonuclease
MPSEKYLGERAHAMRRDPTEPEKRLWRHLSNSQLGGFKVRRQAVIAPFIADFLGPAKALVVEVDGDTHEVEGIGGAMRYWKVRGIGCCGSAMQM